MINYEKPFVFNPIRCKQCGLEFGLITVGKMTMAEPDTLCHYCPYCGASLNTVEETTDTRDEFEWAGEGD